MAQKSRCGNTRAEDPTKKMRDSNIWLGFLSVSRKFYRERHGEPYIRNIRRGQVTHFILSQSVRVCVSGLFFSLSLFARLPAVPQILFLDPLPSEFCTDHLDIDWVKISVCSSPSLLPQFSPSGGNMDLEGRDYSWGMVETNLPSRR